MKLAEVPKNEHAGQEGQDSPFILALGRLCFFQKGREYSGVNAFIPIIPLMPPKETEGGNGAFSNVGTEGFAVLETVTAVATIMGMSGPQLTMFSLEIFLI